MLSASETKSDGVPEPIEEELTEIDTEELEDELLVPFDGDELIPGCGMEDEDVERLNVPYSTRGPNDWVSSGTLDGGYAERAETEGLRRKRYFPSWDEAERWARSFFGDRFKGRVTDAMNSGAPIWAFVIRGPRGVNV